MVAISAFLPTQPQASGSEVLRSGLGALVGIFIAGGVSTICFGDMNGALLLIAPMGASAVLLFGVPASPLAQPYAILGGNLLSALIGVTLAHLIPSILVAGSLAVALSVAAMACCRCLHPPSGAVALTAILGGPHVLAAGYGFVAIPVLLNTLLLVAAAFAYNNFSGRSYPHRSHPVVHPHPANVPIRLSRQDVEEILADYGETLAIGADDLEMLFEEMAARTLRNG